MPTEPDPKVVLSPLCRELLRYINSVDYEGLTYDEADRRTAISIPPSAWHRIRVGPQNFVSVSFHTVPAEGLIEETPVSDDLSITTQRAYHA